MLHATTSPGAKREQLRRRLRSGELLRFPGAINPLSARLIEEYGFEGVYVSGAVLAADLGLPDIGLTTLTEVAARSGQIARMSERPTIVDADTGFGEPMNVARTIQVLEDAGLAGCHIEDQVNPKRCGHLEGKQVVETEDAVRRIRAAVQGRRDENFLIMARTDVRAVAGIDAAIERAQAYVEAGADAIFPEAMQNLSEFEKVSSAVDVPVLANMTEFGKSELFTTEQLAGVGVQMVIYPVTLLRLAMGAVEDGLAEITRQGTQREIVPRMQTRRRLYEVVDYAGYSAFDTDIFTSTGPIAGEEDPSESAAGPAHSP